MARSSYVYIAIHPIDHPEGGIPIRACTVKREFVQWINGLTETARDRLSYYRMTDSGDRIARLQWRELVNQS
jgi:hypothetical protein